MSAQASPRPSVPVMLTQQHVRDEGARRAVEVAIEAVRRIPIADATVATRQLVLGELLHLGKRLEVEGT